MPAGPGQPCGDSILCTIAQGCGRHAGLANPCAANVPQPPRRSHCPILGVSASTARSCGERAIFCRRAAAAGRGPSRCRPVAAVSTCACPQVVPSFVSCLHACASSSRALLRALFCATSGPRPEAALPVCVSLDDVFLSCATRVLRRCTPVPPAASCRILLGSPSFPQATPSCCLRTDALHFSSCACPVQTMSVTVTLPSPVRLSSPAQPSPLLAGYWSPGIDSAHSSQGRHCRPVLPAGLLCWAPAAG